MISQLLMFSRTSFVGLAMTQSPGVRLAVDVLRRLNCACIHSFLFVRLQCGVEGRQVLTIVLSPQLICVERELVYVLPR